MTKTLDQIETELAAAETLIRTLRGEREAALTAACPHRVGDTFSAGGREYRVQKVSPGGRGRTVYLHCHYRTSAKQWSQGTKLVSHEV
jgi:hypothetical protein